MTSKTTLTRRKGVLLALATFAVTALTAAGTGAQTAAPNGADREPNFRSLRERGDIRFLPAPLQDRRIHPSYQPDSFSVPQDADLR